MFIVWFRQKNAILIFIGKDWVDLQKEKVTSSLEIKEAEMRRKQLLKERDVSCV